MKGGQQFSRVTDQHNNFRFYCHESERGEREINEECMSVAIVALLPTESVSAYDDEIQIEAVAVCYAYHLISLYGIIEVLIKTEA